ncbi:MAG: T9SS type A sorting domain-containing protein, partial [Rhodothermales bacterium]|nr:T9SS type A sorting domain-containing protein [Rhodothermales bacterium]
KHEATIPISLETTSTVRVDLVDILGRVVAQVMPSTALPPGEHAVAINAGTLPSGRYIVRVDVDGRVESQKITLVR